MNNAAQNDFERVPASWWTGPRPIEGQLVQSLPQINLVSATREDFLAYFNCGWLLSEVLFSAIKEERAFYQPPYHSLRHPMIFYYAHPAVLYVNKLRVAGLLNEPVDNNLEHIFEVGVDEMSWDDMSKNQMQWPTVGEVHAYRKKVYALVKNLIRPWLPSEDPFCKIVRCGHWPWRSSTSAST
jgi:hypothetical protein